MQEAVVVNESPEVHLVLAEGSVDGVPHDDQKLCERDHGRHTLASIGRRDIIRSCLCEYGKSVFGRVASHWEVLHVVSNTLLELLGSIEKVNLFFL